MMFAIGLALSAASLLVSAQDASQYGKLLVIGGREAQFTVELVDLKDASNTVCPAMPNYPGSGEGITGSYIGGKALVCGGWGNNNNCYSYDKTSNSWQQTVNMGRNRFDAASVKLSDTLWWITAGHDGSNFLSSSEIYDANANSFSAYENMPADKLTLHNLVQVNATHYMLLGGYFPTKKTWMFDTARMMWTALPDMLEERSNTHAGLVRYPDGRRAVVVGGGVDLYSPNHCEIFDLESQTWRYGPYGLPTALCCGASVANGDSFFVVGGRTYEGAMDTIFTFDPAEEKWVEMEQKLDLGRFWFSAFLVPDDFAECRSGANGLFGSLVSVVIVSLLTIVRSF